MAGSSETADLAGSVAGGEGERDLGDVWSLFGSYSGGFEDGQMPVPTAATRGQECGKSDE